jgi:hypothetical protein
MIQSGDPRSLDVGKPPAVATYRPHRALDDIYEACLAFHEKGPGAPTRLRINYAQWRSILHEMKDTRVYAPPRMSGGPTLTVGNYFLTVELDPTALVAYVS